MYKWALLFILIPFHLQAEEIKKHTSAEDSLINARYQIEQEFNHFQIMGRAHFPEELIEPRPKPNLFIAFPSSGVRGFFTVEIFGLRSFKSGCFQATGQNHGQPV